MDRDRLAKLALWAAVAAGATYLFADWLAPSPAAATIWKGAGVALLAIYAALKARNSDGWLIAAVMALGATGDVLLETSGLTVGAVAFLAGHCVAIWLYVRNRRPALSRSQALLALLLVPVVVATAYMLPSDRAMALPIAFYATGLALMAASAWVSRFPRYVTGLGAMAFVASDLLIFARSGPLHGVMGVSVAVWVLYFLGQAMICVGVVTTLRSQD